MKVVIINKSDSTGGAAIVSLRLMKALRSAGVDARMLVAEKLTESPYVELAAEPWRLKWSFLIERLKIFLANGLNRKTLFKIDTGTDGVPLHEHPLVKQADVVCLNWVNQGLLSIKEAGKIAALGKPVIWTMHDMWNMTGICHHAGRCDRFAGDCGHCPLLGQEGEDNDLSRRVQLKKEKLYSVMRGGSPAIHFVAVSNWLAERARQSSLLSEMPVSVIPNAFPFPKKKTLRPAATARKFRILFGAARLDDPIKGLPILLHAMEMLCKRAPELAERAELVTFGAMKDPDAFAGVSVPHRHLGVLHGEDAVREAYLGCDCVVSTSSYETLPGTLVEGQAYGCVPVSFDRGGQRDIVDHKETGYIAEWDDDPDVAGSRIADGLIWAAAAVGDELRRRMEISARERFGEEAVADAYIELFRQASMLA